ncbi:MAG: isochorismatase family protein [Sphingomonadales bacterium]
MSGRNPKDFEQDYRSAGFGHKLGFGAKPALILVDWFKAYLEKSSPLYAGVEAELEVAKILLTAARKNGIPVVFTKVEYMPGGADGGHYYRKVPSLKHLYQGSPLTELADGLSPQKGEFVITKQYPSGFFGTNLSSILTTLGVDTVLVSGLSTSGCVRATVLDALQYGYIPVVVADGCGDRSEEVQKANLFDMDIKCGDVETSETVLKYLNSL